MSEISRRTVLRGAGVALALPWLESLPAWGRAFPQRFAVLFMGNGISGNHWWAKGSGAAMTVSRTLAPLEPLKSKINVVNGLFNEPAVGRGIHPAQTGNLLSGVPLRKGTLAESGITVDQVLANRFGRETPVKSLALACEQPLTGHHESGFSLAYSSHISWRRADAPVPGDVHPVVAFDNLFENRGQRRGDSILDAVLDGVRRLTRTVAATDRAALDRYLTSVRDVELRIERLESPVDVREHLRLLCDIVALAFQTDSTRVASLVLARDLSALSYPFLDVRDDHHTASHEDLSDAYERICRFHVGQLAYLAAALDAMPEGDGSVLDHSCVLWLSNMWSGWKHDNRKLPVLTAGRLGGALKTGRSLDYLYDGDANRKLCSLYLSIMDKMGVTLDRFGDADARLKGF